MPYSDLLILLPCHSLEDFPHHHEGADADSLLAGWTALWHPALIQAAGQAPNWQRVDDPPERLDDCLLIIPTISVDQLPTGFLQRAKDSGATVIRRQTDRDKILDKALAALRESPPESGPAPTEVDQELAQDFMALGYCFLQVELLTRQMRYASNLDEVHFRQLVLEAARSAVGGEPDEAKRRLQACFDLLSEERDHYYSVEAYLLDVTLVAPTTLGAALAGELAAPTATNLLLSGELVEQLAAGGSAEAGASLERLREALAAGRVGLIGGGYAEYPLPLATPEGLLDDLIRGQRVYQQHLGRAPLVYGRRRSGLTPLLPSVLSRLGFQGALHASFEGANCPEGSQVKTRWEGSDGSSLDCLARLPLDAARPETFLNLATRLGESMDMDHVATICLAHWPGAASPWYDALRRCAAYGAALGRFLTVDDYFRDTDLPPHNDRFEADQYSTPYLKQAVVRKQPDPISRVVRYWQAVQTAAARQTLETLGTLISPPPGPPAAEARSEPAGDSNAPSAAGAPLERLLDAPETEPAETEPADSLDPPRSAPATLGGGELTRCLLGGASMAAGAGERPGALLLNPASFVQRLVIDQREGEQLPPVERPVYAADRDERGGQWVVDVPSMGYSWVPLAPPAAARGRRQQPLAEEGLLRNEFFEALVHPETGGLRSLHTYEQRGNRLSQQLALRQPAARGSRSTEARYSTMRAESVEITRATAVSGEITSRGQLLDDQRQVVANFTQVFRANRGSRVLLVDIELEPLAMPAADPWNAYYGLRFAWGDPAASLWRTQNMIRCAAESRRLDAPLYLDIQSVQERTTILTGGLPYHRRFGLSQLDTLLIVPGERARRFRLGIGVDLKNPLHDALGLLSPQVHQPVHAAPPRVPSSWLFHFNSRNVVATHWEPWLEQGQLRGVRFRVLESTGRRTTTRLACFRPFAAARQRDFQGGGLGELEIVDGAVQIELTANQWLEVEAEFAPPGVTT